MGMTLTDLTGEIKEKTTEDQPPANGDVQKLIDEEQKENGSSPQWDTASNNGTEVRDTPKELPQLGVDASIGADLITGTIDMTQTYVFRAAHRWKYGRYLIKTYGADAKQKLKELIEDIDRKKAAKEPIQNLTYEEWEMYYMHQKHNHIIDEIPFKPHEIEKWQKCLKPFIEQNGGNIPANWAITLTAITTLAPRAADVIFEKV